MPVLKYWESVEYFSASDAAFLVLGVEPETTPNKHFSSHQHLVHRMHRAFIETCGHFRYCVERELESNEIASLMWQLDGEAELVLLASVEMSGLSQQYESAKSRRGLSEYRRFALRWLDGALDQFDRQKFSRRSLSNWLYWLEISSEFDFEARQAVTPEQRRDTVKRVVDDCDGNKSEAARRLGISRTRVDQLLKGSTDGGNPLRSGTTGPVAHNPFSLGKG